MNRRTWRISTARRAHRRVIRLAECATYCDCLIVVRSSEAEVMHRQEHASFQNLIATDGTTPELYGADQTTQQHERFNTESNAWWLHRSYTYLPQEALNDRSRGTMSRTDCARHRRQQSVHFQEAVDRVVSCAYQEPTTTIIATTRRGIDIHVRSTTIAAAAFQHLIRSAQYMHTSETGSSG
jgi:hypothetical protein